VADPSRETGTPTRAPAGPVAVGPRANRPPRPANDNSFPWLRQASRVVPLLAAVALLAWALIHAFGVL
jgi:hypothetical protein